MADRLCLWGEDGAAAPRTLSSRTTSAAPRGRIHPFAIPGDRLNQALWRSLGNPHRAEFTTVLLQLPSLPTGPLPSWHSPPAGANLATWRVPVVALSPADAVAFLLATPMDVDGSDVQHAWSGSLRFLARVAEFACGLVARGRMLPQVRENHSGFEAIWSAVPSATDRAVLERLADAMPGLCRAEVFAEDHEGWPTGALLRRIVDELVDAAARTALDDRPLVPRRRRAPDPAVVASWLTGLSGDRRPIDAEPVALAQLCVRAEDMVRSVETATGGVRLCLRLGEPATTRQSWQVDFLLQAVDDPSLLIDADRVWRQEAVVARALGRGVAHPQERLLGDLGRVARLWPKIEEALSEVKPEGIGLDATSAAEFLRTAAPALEDAGYGVLLPGWWRNPQTRLGARLRVSQRTPQGGIDGGLGLAALCDYRYELSLGDTVLTETELRRLARLKQPLIRLRGEWVVVDDAMVAKALDLVEGCAQHGGTMTAADGLRIGLGLEPSAFGVPITGLDADGWLGELLDGGERRLTPATTPEGFSLPLRPYQERGLGWLAFLDSLGLGGCLADDMGLGKTAQLLALVVAERARPVRGRRRSAKRPPTLVVCPMTLVGNWQREAARFAPRLRVLVHHGSDRHTDAAFAQASAASDLVITTYGLVLRDEATLATVDWGRVVLDEAQAIKNPESKVSRAVRRLPAGQRLALTGTPVENRLAEMWSLMDFCNPGLLGTAGSFQRRLARPIERAGDDAAAETLRRITGPFVLRRLKNDRSIIDDLPDKLEMKTWCALTREQATLYQAVVDDMLERIESSEGIERKALVLTTMLKLKQVCNHPAQLLKDGSRFAGRSGKLARVEELLAQILDDGERVLCFTQFTQLGEPLRRHLETRFHREVLWFHGGTTKSARDAMVARFQSEDGPPIFLLSIKAGGTGLNLTAASHVIHFDRWWNPAVENQATDRAYRIGQHRTVQVRKLICAGTLEERIDELIERKQALAERIVGAGEGWLTELSTAALRDIISLSADAVAED